jgi:hypothetical protein
MKLNILLDYLNFVSAKETEGESMPPKQFNVVLESINIEAFDREIEVIRAILETENVSLKNLVEKNLKLRPFFKEGYGPVLPSPGLISFPDDFSMFLGLSVKDTITGVYKVVEPISHKEYLRRQQGVIVRSFELPISIYNDNQIEVRGKDFDAYILYYVKVPVKPYFDYCIDVGLSKYVYMNVGDYIELNSVTTQYELKNSGGTVLNDNVIHTFYTSGGTGIYTSISVELEWEEKDHMFFARQMLIKMGINLRDQQLQRYAEQSNSQQQPQA